mmetsp:Transcript_32863/g.71721  ORF Transcript_32863/g.71721 Transcript_32863/m.71721 type:complete len:222 (-) Transcript_32863:15-680(-)
MAMPSSGLSLAFVALTLLVLRALFWLLSRVRRRCHGAPPRRAWEGSELPLRTLVVLGSGGHTMEMLGLLKDIDQTRYRCDFILADTDSTSLKKVAAARPDLAEPCRFHTVPRSREVGQSWLSSAVSTAKSLLACLGLVWRLQPQVLLINGPGTCIPVAAAAMLFEVLLGRSIVVIFVESFCRVKSLSLTGRLLYPIADAFIVHWPGLLERYPKAQHCGVLL